MLSRNPLNTILIADSQTLTVVGIKHLFADKGNVKITSATEKSTLFELIDDDLSLIIIDYLTLKGFQNSDMIELRERYPHVPILVITSDTNKQSILQILESKVNGFLFKDCLEDEIIRAVETILRGEKFFCNKVFDILMETRQQKVVDNTLPTALTSREMDIIKLVVAGQSTVAIAEHLNLSPHTISTHRKNIIKKLKIKSPVELVTYAYDLGLLTAKTWVN